MNAQRRDKRRRDWPRGLYEPRAGYYVWRTPSGTTYVLGRIPFAHARAEAIAANAHIAEQAPSLVQRLSGEAHTIADLIGQMPEAKARNTAKSWRSLDKQIRAALGGHPCGSLTTKHCAELIEGVEAQGKGRSAEALRSRLIAVCNRGQQLGWMAGNPAEPTRRPEVAVKRGRLTLEQFRAILAVADQVAEWLPQAMRLALVTGADRDTIASLTRDNVRDDCLVYTRGKTGISIAVPLDLTLEAAGLVLRDVVRHRSGVLSRHLVHHVSPWGNAPTGSDVHPDTITRAFTNARALAGIPDMIDGKGAPTFYEMRSLAKRLYEAQGNVDTKALLGHTTEKMSNLYSHPRGIEVVRVRVSNAQQVNSK